MICGDLVLRLRAVGLDDRCVLMVDVTCHTLQSDPELRLCEGLRLIDATRKAVGRMSPHALEAFENRIVPHMREVLLERFGLTDWDSDAVN
jgi:hypothetical protein